MKITNDIMDTIRRVGVQNFLEGRFTEQTVMDVLGNISGYSGVLIGGGDTKYAGRYAWGIEEDGTLHFGHLDANSGEFQSFGRTEAEDYFSADGSLSIERLREAMIVTLEDAGNEGVWVNRGDAERCVAFANTSKSVDNFLAHIQDNVTANIPSMSRSASVESRKHSAPGNKMFESLSGGNSSSSDLVESLLSGEISLNEIL